MREQVMANQKPAIELMHISKKFPGVKALDDITLSASAGEVHAICGENGAGKSTLMKIINGIYKPDSGEVFIDGEAVRINSPLDAKARGIAMVYQECAYVPEMTVEESMFLGNLPKNRLGTVDWKFVRERAQQLLEQEQMIKPSQLPYGLKTKLKDVSLANIQLLEIIKAISSDAKIIIMDEPTSSLPQYETDMLLEKILELKKRGKCILYISHKMDEIFQISDTVTVFRDGQHIGTKPASELTIDQVVSMMVGRELANDYPKEDAAIGKVMLEVRNLHKKGVFRDVSFNVKAGEIVGLAGLVGAGRTEVAMALSGVDPYDEGTVEVAGQPVTISSVKDGIRHNIAMVSEDRRRYGLVDIRNVRENMALPNLEKFIHSGFLHSRDENKAVNEKCESMRIKTPTIDTVVKNLSGGNQQKVVLAKWLIKDTSIMILDEPTRGIDVGAKYEIYKLMSTMAQEGKAIVMISSEMPELLGMCDRLYVMHEGRIEKEFKRSEFSQEKIMHYAAGTHKSKTKTTVTEGR
jgi:inositol transport system ATP-binding protein